MKSSFFLSSLVFAALCGCKSNSDFSKAQAFENLDSTKVRPLGGLPALEISEDLFRVSGLKELGIKHKVLRIPIHAEVADNKRNPRDPYASFYTKVTFGPITETQYSKLKSRYGGLSRVPFNAAKSDWLLSDFLPPLIQALDGHRFVEEHLPVPDWIPQSFIQQNRLDPTLFLQTNCFATAYEVARSILAQETPFNFIAFFLGDVSMSSFFHEKFTASNVEIGNKSFFEGSGFELRNRGRQFGDFLEFNNPMSLHAAVWIDNDLYFEKVDTASSAPYRLVTFSDMIQVSNLQDELKSPSAQLKFIRFSSAKMQPPEQFFGGYSNHPILYGGKLYPGETFTSLGINGPSSNRLFVSLFSLQLGGTGGALHTMKSFALQYDPASGRAVLPQDAFRE